MNTVYDDLIRFAPDGFIHDNQRLAELQALPLHRKIGITIARITEWYNHFNGNVYVSISGGKDSTVLWDIVHKLFPDVPAVFSNTGLEYPEIQQFAKSICDDVVSPKMSFTEVIKTYGYPLISKEISEAIYYARRNTPPPRSRVETTGTHRQQTSNQTSRLLGRQTIWKRLELMGQRPACARIDYWNSQVVPSPPMQDLQLIKSEQNYTERDKTNILRMLTRRSLPLIKKSGFLLSIFRLRYRTTVAM